MPTSPKFADRPWLRLAPAILASIVLCGCTSTPRTHDQAPVPPAAKVAYERALATMQAGHADEAIDRFKAIAHRYPALSGPYINLGILYTRQHELDKAQTVLEHAVHCKPTRAVTYNQLGIVYRRQGHFERAKRAYLEALRIDPGLQNAYLNLGILYDIYFNDLKQALFYYKSYQRLQGEADPQVARWIADVRLRRATQVARSTTGERP
ncbi:MAG TPA: tetratricopeptide repeat protein [Gammaproteobacteria bacterium]|nr:tetratricopeptide repeat protein [Gammaproteobacteria bacterium]